MLSGKIVLKSGPRCPAVAIGKLCRIKKFVIITSAFMTSVDVELAAVKNCEICLLVFDCVTTISCDSLSKWTLTSLILGDRTEHVYCKEHTKTNMHRFEHV